MKLGWIEIHSQSNSYFQIVWVDNVNNSNLYSNPIHKIWFVLDQFFFFFVNGCHCGGDERTGLRDKEELEIGDGGGIEI